MGVHYSEFERMFEVLKKDAPLPLKIAVKKWEYIKEAGEETIQNWLEVLKEKTRFYIDEGYSIGAAMMKAWGSSYGGIYDDSEKWYFNISELRETFFEGADVLEGYEEHLIVKVEKYPCKSCEWFVLNHVENKGYCNNFSIERKIKDSCISEEE